MWQSGDRQWETGLGYGGEVRGEGVESCLDLEAKADSMKVIESLGERNREQRKDVSRG